MKLPNGFGTVYKLSGNRRNPYVAKKTKGWENDPKTGKSKQLYTVVGYYPTRKEALTALAEFNANPYDVNATIETLYMSSNLEKTEFVKSMKPILKNIPQPEKKKDIKRMVVRDRSGYRKTPNGCYCLLKTDTSLLTVNK